MAIMRLLILTLAAFGLLSAPALASPPARIPANPAFPKPHGKPTRQLVGIPDVMQVNEYSCGPAAVQAILSYYGVWGYQADFAKELGTSPDQGTHPVKMTAYLKKWGLDAKLVKGLKPADLRRYVDQGVPVIVDFQAWGVPAGKDYKNEWEDGHYTIVLGYDRTGFFMEDPSLLGTIGYLSEKELNRRWHDYEVEGGKRVDNYGLAIVVKGKKQVQPAISPIE
jgi:predicted double-glycine peptidase